MAYLSGSYASGTQGAPERRTHYDQCISFRHAQARLVSCNVAPLLAKSLPQAVVGALKAKLVLNRSVKHSAITACKTLSQGHYNKT